MIRKNVSEITIEEWIEFPVWEFTNDDEETDDLLMRPVTDLPVTFMGGRVVFTKLRPANGLQVQATLSNLELEDEECTQVFLGVGVFKKSKWFFLSRYFDPDYQRNGPNGLAEFLGLDVAAIFPMNYDVSEFCSGKDPAVRGQILADPAKRLSESELMRLILRKPS